CAKSYTSGWSGGFEYW
nr:immunoglobulin heavy chain junction region [Macaca mulatta]MOX38202.1 immunoglobulin heavy chain junction region [Macaca mulatta]MOX38464.1 immunoglobulin heavy chain junction region [Macaca mulatta]MOX38626.1 immunoglobulin heavy chain junction region [Macaca mulatta]MOX39006.1 immunoglobulin heavy chain junction region [Macaca mulatta]